MCDHKKKITFGDLRFQSPWCFSFSSCLLGLHFYVVVSEHFFWFGDYALFRKVVMLLGFYV
jgi:hypothetical protein